MGDMRDVSVSVVIDRQYKLVINMKMLPGSAYTPRAAATHLSSHHASISSAEG